MGPLFFTQIPKPRCPEVDEIAEVLGIVRLSEKMGDVIKPAPGLSGAMGARDFEGGIRVWGWFCQLGSGR